MLGFGLVVFATLLLLLLTASLKSPALAFFSAIVAPESTTSN